MILHSATTARRSGITRTDEVVGYAAANSLGVRPPVTIRRWFEHGTFIRADLYVGGWSVGTYKTEAGVTRRAAKEIA